MKIIKADKLKTKQMQGSVLTIGNFDGVHLGHKKILDRVVLLARKNSVPAVVYTFKPHPVSVLNPQRAPKLITSFDHKMKILEGLGIDMVVIAEFDRKYAKKSAEEFLKDEITKKIGPSKILIGQNFCFGRDREGTVDTLLRMGKKLGFEVEAISPVVLDGIPVSSTNIRRYIERGDMETAAKLLGRRFSISGKVISGHHRGKELGFPTANMHPPQGIYPPHGVYAVLAELEGREYPAVTNIGTNPTFEDGATTLETYILDFQGDLYNKELTLRFIRRLRDEKKFSSSADLVDQIEKDVRETRRLLEKSTDEHSLSNRSA